MTIKMFIAGFAAIVLMLSYGVAYAAPDNPGTGQGGWHCPWNGQGRMMSYGPGWGCPMGGQRGAYQQGQGQPLTNDQSGWSSRGSRCPRAAWR